MLVGAEVSKGVLGGSESWASDCGSTGHAGVTNHSPWSKSGISNQKTLICNSYQLLLTLVARVFKYLENKTKS